MLADPASPEAAWHDRRFLPPGVAYSHWAATYDTPGNPVVDGEEPVMREILSGLAAGTALDAGAGTGRQSALLHQLGHEVIALDANRAMLAVLRGRMRGVAAVQASLEALPLGDRSLDLVVCSLALTHVSRLEPAMREFRRVVRPGGHIVLSDVHPVFVMVGVQAAFNDGDGRRFWTRNETHWPSDYLRAFRESGLTVERCEELPCPTGVFEQRPGAAAEVVDIALAGVPMVLIWVLSVPR